MQEKKIKQLTKEELSYIAGFLEGDGCLLAQIVKGSTYRFKHTVRLGIIFYQKKDKHWFFLWLKKKIGIGNIRIRNDSMMEYSIMGMIHVKIFLKSLFPFLVLKKDLAVLMFRIIEGFEKVESEADFLEVCKLVDKVADYTFSKRRINTTSKVRESLGLPVETEKNS